MGPHTWAWMLTLFILSTGVGAVDPTQAIFEVSVLVVGGYEVVSGRERMSDTVSKLSGDKAH
jgi:hypothetical protein